MFCDEPMQDIASLAAAGVVSPDLEQEFEARLVESSTLAFRVAFAVLRHRQDAEDVAQEAFVRARRSFHQLRERDRFRAWLVRTTWRLAIDRWRSDRRRASRELRTGMTICATTHETVEAADRAARLWAAIDALPEKFRTAIVLAGIEGHDVREVAALLALPEGTVKSRLFTARQMLKELLRSMGVGERHG
jgi:RNA polymerase sigma-70 factor, ECF subfamily